MLPLLFAAAATGVTVDAVAGPAGAAPTVARPETANASRPPPDVQDAPALRRSGIAFGLSLGAGVGGGSGYPNDSQKIGDPQFYSAKRFMPGTSETLLVMGALADYLNFGFWFGSSAFRSGDSKAVGTGIGLRTEVFPLLKLAPRFDGLGMFAQFGFGSGSLSTPSAPKAEGTQSILGFGAFYEWSLGHFLGGHLGLGPSVEYDALWSQPFEEHGFVVSGRVLFYGGP